MKAKRHLLNEVRKDRRNGMSLGDLSKKYKLSKSTVSLWCKDIRLSDRAKTLINEKWLKITAPAREKGTLANKSKRMRSIENEYVEAKKVLGTLSERDRLVMGVGLYWAEGSKKETGSGFSFINSDPLMIKLIYSWLIDIMHISKNQLIIHLAVNISHKQREHEILKFWSNLLDFRLEDFGNTTFIKTPHKKIYQNNLNYFGMLRIKARSSSGLRRRINGMIKIFTQDADVAQVARAFHS